MVKKPIDWNQLNWRNQDVIVKFDHLNPALQFFIGGKESALGTLRFGRRLRFFSEGLMAASLFLPPPISYFGIAGGVATRTASAKSVQESHDFVGRVMKHFGLLQTRFEGYYPMGEWMNAAII